MRKRGEILLKALEIFEEITYTTADFMEAFFSSTKSDYRPLRNFVPKPHKTIAEEIRKNVDRKEAEAREKQKIYNLISYLKRDELIAMVKNGRECGWKITPSGERKKESIKLQLASAMPVKNYTAIKSQETLIISFDVPEKERRKRWWLRLSLKNLGLQMLHKSVWMGKVKLPAEFINDLRKYHLMPYLHIFSVAKSGTLKQIV